MPNGSCLQGLLTDNVPGKCETCRHSGRQSVAIKHSAVEDCRMIGVAARSAAERRTGQASPFEILDEYRVPERVVVIVHDGAFDLA